MAKVEQIALNALKDEIEGYGYAARNATESKKEGGGFRESSLLKEATGGLRTFRNELTPSNAFEEWVRASELSGIAKK